MRDYLQVVEDTTDALFEQHDDVLYAKCLEAVECLLRELMTEPSEDRMRRYVSAINRLCMLYTSLPQHVYDITMSYLTSCDARSNPHMYCLILELYMAWNDMTESQQVAYENALIELISKCVVFQSGFTAIDSYVRTHSLSQCLSKLSEFCNTCTGEGRVTLPWGLYLIAHEARNSSDAHIYEKSVELLCMLMTDAEPRVCHEANYLMHELGESSGHGLASGGISNI